MTKVEQVTAHVRGRLRNVGYRAFIGEHATGLGATPTRAKEQALVYAEAVLTGHYNPTMVRLGEHFAVVYREPCGWHTTHIRAASDYPEGHSKVYGNGGDASESDAIRSCKMHMAQIAFEPANDQYSARRILMFVDAADVGDLKHWIGFQRAWHAMQAAGGWSMSTALADNKIHEWASQHAREYAPSIDIDSPDWIVSFHPATFHMSAMKGHDCPCTACEDIRKETT